MVVYSLKISHIEISIALIKQHGLTYDKITDKVFLEMLKVYRRGLIKQASPKIREPLIKQIDEILEDKRYNH